MRRASAGLSAVRAGAALAMLVSAAAIYGVGASSAFDYTKLQLDGLTYTDQNAVEAALAERPRREPVRAVHDGPRERPRIDADRQVGPGPGPAAGHARGDDRGARPGPHLAGRRRSATSSTRTAPCSASWPPRRRRPRRAFRSSTTAGRRSALLQVGQRLDPVDLDAATRLASLVPGRHRLVRGRAGGQRDRRERVRRQRQAGRLVGRLRLLHAEPAHDRPHPRAGPAAPEPARRARGAGRQDRPRLGDGRDVHAATSSPAEDARSRARRREVARARAVG